MNSRVLNNSLPVEARDDMVKRMEALVEECIEMGVDPSILFEITKSAIGRVGLSEAQKGDPKGSLATAAA